MPLDRRPLDDVLIGKALQILENGITNLSGGEADDGLINFAKAMKRLLEANYILAYINSEVVFGESDIAAILDIFKDYQEEITKEVHRWEKKERDRDARQEFIAKISNEIQETLTRAEFVMNRNITSNMARERIRKYYEDIKIRCFKIVRESILNQIARKVKEEKPSGMPMEAFYDIDNVSDSPFLAFYIMDLFKKDKTVKEIEDELLKKLDNRIKEKAKPLLHDFILGIHKAKEHLEKIPVIIDLKFGIGMEKQMTELLEKQKGGRIRIVFVETEEGLAEKLHKSLGNNPAIVSFGEIIDANNSIDANKLQAGVIDKFKEFKIEEERVIKESYLYVHIDNKDKFFEVFEGIINAIIVGEEVMPISYEIMNIGVLERFIQDMKELGVNFTEDQLKMVLKDKPYSEKWITSAVDAVEGKGHSYLKQVDKDKVKAIEAAKTQEEEL